MPGTVSDGWVNPWAGEVALTIDGERRVLKLTLGALAELEENLAEPSLVDLVERFEQGRFSSRDVVALVVAGLRGGGWRGSSLDLISADIAGGPVEAAKVAGQLLVRAFALPGDTVVPGGRTAAAAGRGSGTAR